MLSKIINKFSAEIPSESLEEQVQKKFQQALSLHQAGQLLEAQTIYSEVLKIQPQHANSLHFLGVAAYQTKNPQLAVDLITQAIAINPKSAAFYSNLGVALMDLKDLDRALDSYEKAIAINSTNPDFHYNRGNILAELKKLDLAIISYERAIELNPNNAGYYYNRGNVFKENKQLDLAIRDYEKAIELNPDHEIYYAYANILLELKKLDLAIASYQRAIQLKPDYAEAYSNLGNAFVDLEDNKTAIDHYEKAVFLKPDYSEGYHNLATALVNNQQIDLAITSYYKVLQLKPDFQYLAGEIFFAKSKICDWNSYYEEKSILEKKIKEGKKVVAPFHSLSLVDSPELQRRASEIYVQQYDIEYAPEEISKKERNKKIRIGYYSADFHAHAMGYLLANLYEFHNKSKFELIAFSFGPDRDDETRKRIAAAFDKFIDVRLKNDEEIAALSREMGIDVAVDLNGFTQNMRLGIFAFRCAPIQVNYLGYPGTMAAPYMDYIIADKIVIPEENKKYYSEKIAYLPNSYQPNDSKRQILDKNFTRQELGLPEDGFVFCCFNNNFKILPQTFESWMRILKAVPDSLIWLFEDNESAAKNLRKEAEKRGVESGRLIFAKRTKLEDHLARQKSADLFLDTLPYNAHTTCSDALWAGLPVLTLIGKSFASRVAASLLNAIRLPELITNSEQEYEEKAIELALNSEKLKEVKEKLEKHRLTTPLFDTKLFAKHIEAAYEEMYKKYQDDLAPSNIEIS